MLKTPSACFNILVLDFEIYVKSVLGKKAGFILSLWITPRKRTVAFLPQSKVCLCSLCFHHCSHTTRQLPLILSGPHIVPCDLNIFVWRGRRPRSKLTCAMWKFKVVRPWNKAGNKIEGMENYITWGSHRS